MFISRTLLAVLLGLCAACSPIRSYKKTEAVRSWEKDIRLLEKRDSTESYSERALLFTGSSSIRLWDSIKTDLEPYEVIQRGYGGAKFSDFACYIDRISSPHKTQAVAIFVANDITGSKDDKTPEEVLRLFRYSARTIRKDNPEAKIFFIEITPTPSRWHVWPQIQKANSLIRSYCERQQNMFFIQTHNRFLDASGLPDKSLFRDDQLHLTRTGYKLWREIILDELKEHL